MVKLSGKSLCHAAMVGAMLLLSACAGGYSQYYTPSNAFSPADLSARRVAPPPVKPDLVLANWNSPDAGSDLDAMMNAYARRGYALIGSSVFRSTHSQSETDAVEQGARIGADLAVVLPPRFAGTSTSVEPVTLPPPYWYGGGMYYYGRGWYGRPVGWRYGPGPWHRGWHSGWYGDWDWYGPETAWVPVTVSHNDYAALYFVKMRWRFGVLYTDLDDAARRAIGSNKGAEVSVVVDGSPAYNADIVPGDIIIALNGADVINAEDFNRRIEDPALKEVSVIIRRGERTLKKTIPLAE